MQWSRIFLVTVTFIFLLSLVPIQNVQSQGSIQVVVHSVSIQPQGGKVAYSLRVYASVLDENGVPIKDLKVENFSLLEDSQPRTIESTELALNESINLVLVMDTSGSMTGQPMIDARNAAANFLSRLGKNDRLAVLSFNDKISTVVPFTQDHQSASEAVKQISAVPRAGTCLYDAAYQAVELASTAPQGRRAVILFTDGKDEVIGGGRCSFRQHQDVIDLAKISSIPIYTLGLGKEIEESELRRLAANTGGVFIKSRDLSELELLFSRLYEQLNNHYVIVFTSQNAPGPHLLSLGVQYRGQTSQTTYTFVLPELPTSLTITSPAEGENISGIVTIRAKLLTQGTEIGALEFAINGVVIGKDISEPYELEWDASKYDPGEVLIEVVALSKGGAELARSGIRANIEEKTTPEVKEGTSLSDEETKIVDGQISPTNFLSIFLQQRTWVYIAIGAVIVILSGMFLIVFSRKARKKKVEGEEPFKPLQSSKDEDVTIEELRPLKWIDENRREIPLASLTVLASNDPLMIGNQYSLSKFPVVLGRSVEKADIVFSSKDLGVSRQHAMIELSGNIITLKDYGSKYGTFLNGRTVGMEPTPLKNGDEIKLGSRVILKFEQIEQEKKRGDETFDEISTDLTYDDETRDALK